MNVSSSVCAGGARNARTSSPFEWKVILLRQVMAEVALLQTRATT
jgi:hypothetical protein